VEPEERQEQLRLVLEDELAASWSCTRRAATTSARVRASSSSSAASIASTMAST